MKRVSTLYFIPFFVCTLLLVLVSTAFSQEVPARIEISWADTSQLPQIELYLIASQADGARLASLGIDHQNNPEWVQLLEDGTEIEPAILEEERGTWVTFLIDADLVAHGQWPDIRESIEGYASPTWMDEELDYVEVLVTNGSESQTVIERTIFHNSVYNGFRDMQAVDAPPIDPLAQTPLGDIAVEALTKWDSLSPTPGMYRALVIFSSGDMAGSNYRPEDVVNLAQSKGIALFPILVGQDSIGESNMRQLASGTGGALRSLKAGGAGALAELWRVIGSHHRQYVVIYPSQLIQSESRSHTVSVAVSGIAVDTYPFELEILPPMVEVTLPKEGAVIERIPQNPGDPLEAYEPSSQAVVFAWEWQDAFSRSAQAIELLINDQVVEQLDLTGAGQPILDWDISALDVGEYTLQVLVTDEWGRVGESNRVLVRIAVLGEPGEAEATAEVAEAETPTAESEEEGEGGGLIPDNMFANIWSTIKRQLGCIGLSGLSLGGLLVAVYTLQRRAKALGQSPFGFLRQQSFFRPFNAILRPIERVIGPIQFGKKKKDKEDKEDKPKKESMEEKIRGQVGRPKKGEPAPKKGAGRPAWLEVTAGKASKPSPIDVPGQLTMGRSATRADIVFDDTTISRLHARIVREHDDKFRIYNHSSQDTWVGGQRVSEHGLALQDGDEIRMGRVVVRFRCAYR